MVYTEKKFKNMVKGTVTLDCIYIVFTSSISSNCVYKSTEHWFQLHPSFVQFGSKVYI